MSPATPNTASFLVIVLALTAFLSAAPASAGTVAYISSTGSDANPCTAAQPCATLTGAIDAAGLSLSGGLIECIDSPVFSHGGTLYSEPSLNLTVDCAGTYLVTGANFGAIVMAGSNQSLKLRNFTISGFAGGNPAIGFSGSGSLILENCVIEDISGGPALDLEPNGHLNLLIKNSRISNSLSGILLKPATGGSINATLDHVTIANNNGGGLRSDTTKGLVTVDITDSVVSNNGGNGINAVGAGDNVVSIEHSVIAKNGSAGVQANGPTTGAIISMTLLDQNVAGATSSVAGGNLFTYGNNRIVGSLGSGFTSTAQPH